MIFDYRLHVFWVAAKRLNFTKSAEELFISQPAVTRHIHELERVLKIKLFERNGAQMKLSQAGEILLHHAERIFGIYREVEFEINALMERQSGSLRLGASTTFAHYILPEILAAFRVKFPEIQVSLTVENSKQIIQNLQNQTIDLAITEGRGRDTSLKFIEFLEDEIVLVAKGGSSISSGQKINMEQLKGIPLLLREVGSGTLEVLMDALKPLGIGFSDLKVEMQMNSSESIKRYVLKSHAMAFLSRHVIEDELEANKFRIVGVEDFAIQRYFCFVLPHGQPLPLSELFMKFCKHFHSKV